jgi:hypothetical protein
MTKVVPIICPCCNRLLEVVISDLAECAIDVRVVDETRGE